MSKSKVQIKNEVPKPNDKKVYDLEERSARFGESKHWLRMIERANPDKKTNARSYGMRPRY